MKKLTKILLLMPLIIATNACGNMEYVNRENYAEITGAAENIRMKRYSDGYKPAREYGALKIGKDIENTENLDTEDKNYYLALKRERQKIYAEALLYENKKHSSWIDQTLLGFGVDKSSRAFNLGLTLKY